MVNITNNSQILHFNRNSLILDEAQETERIINSLGDAVHQTLRRQGAVVGISGGIDLSLVLALCAKTFGPEKVVGVLLPEKSSSPDSAEMAHELAAHFNTQTVTEEITGVLDGFGCYQRRNEAIQRVFPQFEPGWGVKIVLPGDLLDKATLNIFQLVVTDPDGK